MKARNINFILSIPIYPFDIMFSFGQTDAQLRKNLKAAGVNELNYFERTLEIGRCSIFPEGYQVVRLRDYPSKPRDFGVLQHEIFHAVSNLLHRIGMRLDQDSSEEAFTYLIGYITEKVYEKLKVKL